MTNNRFAAIAARSAVAVAAAAVLFALSPRAAEKKVRIIQTNSAGDNVHVIDPVTNKVVGVINGIEVSHGAAVAPDGTRIYVSNEADSTLDFVDGIDTVTMTNVKTLPTKGTIHNAYVTPDGNYVVAGSIAGKTINVFDEK